MTTTNTTPPGPTAPPDPQTSGPRTSRRAVLAAGGAALAGGAVGLGIGRAGAASAEQATTVVEVACVGETWREATPANPGDDGDFRAPFFVEGIIYPEGTIAGDGFIPTNEGSIGQWFCRGYVMVNATRPEPHTSSHQDLHFGTITEESLFPTTMLSTVGLEGTDSREQFSTRAVVGGTGDYLGVTGQMTQRFFATNTSILPGPNIPSPCWRFEFDLRYPPA